MTVRRALGRVAGAVAVSLALIATTAGVVAAHDSPTYHTARLSGDCVSDIAHYRSAHAFSWAVSISSDVSGCQTVGTRVLAQRDYSSVQAWSSWNYSSSQATATYSGGAYAWYPADSQHYRYPDSGPVPAIYTLW